MNSQKPLSLRRLLQRLVRRSSSATLHSLQLFGVASALHRDLGGGGIDVTKVVGREFD